jgi:sulfur carrier protein ThiS
LSDAETVQVSVRLIAMESSHAPELGDHESHVLELPATLSIEELLGRLELPGGRYGVLLNDLSVPSEERDKRLQNGDRLIVFPSIKGGSHAGCAGRDKVGRIHNSPADS